MKKKDIIPFSELLGEPDKKLPKSLPKLKKKKPLVDIVGVQPMTKSDIVSEKNPVMTGCSHPYKYCMGMTSTSETWYCGDCNTEWEVNR